MEQTSLGELELEILRFVAENAPISVGRVAALLSKDGKPARTTVLTVMERLRSKGCLSREKANDEDTYLYSPRVATGDVMKGLVRNFVRKTLGGTVTPFVSYLAEADDLTEEEIAALREFVKSLPETPNREEAQP
jgi:predicted transcriptional regulator